MEKTEDEVMGILEAFLEVGLFRDANNPLVNALLQTLHAELTAFVGVKQAEAYDRGYMRGKLYKEGCVCFGREHARANPEMHWRNPYRIYEGGEDD